VEYFAKGGPIMWVIMFVAFFGLYFLVYKILQALKLRYFFKEELPQLVEKENFFEELGERWNEVVTLFTATTGWKEAWQIKVFSGIEFVETAISISPLLGLLGTFTGLVKAFGATATSNTTKLAEGIAQALYTSIFGLLVAIVLSVALTFVEKLLEDVYMRGVLIRQGEVDGFRGSLDMEG